MDKDYLLVSSLLGDSDWLKLSKKICRVLGNANAAVILSQFIDKRVYFLREGKIKKASDPIFLLQSKISEELGFSTEVVRNAIFILVEKQFLIFLGRNGVPPKNYYQINDSIILKELLKDE